MERGTERADHNDVLTIRLHGGNGFELTRALDAAAIVYENEPLSGRSTILSLPKPGLDPSHLAAVITRWRSHPQHLMVLTLADGSNFEAGDLSFEKLEAMCVQAVSASAVEMSQGD